MTFVRLKGSPKLEFLFNKQILMTGMLNKCSSYAKALIVMTLFKLEGSPKVDLLFKTKGQVCSTNARA
jgi:hypothetical protein